MKIKLVAITGGKGFLGKALIKRLTSLGYIYHLIEKQDYYKPNFKENLEALNPSLIVHMGAFGNHSSQQDDQETFEANVVKTYLLLDATKDIPYEAFINISTSKHVLDCDSMYGATKMSGEYLARAFVKKYQKPIISVRPASIIGKGEQQAHLIPQLIESCLTGKEIPFVGWPTHNFLDIQDLVDAIILLASKAKEYAKWSFSIGNAKIHSNDQIRQMVEKITGKKANIKKVISLRNYDTTEWAVDSSLIRSLGWRPKISIEQSVEQQVASMVELLNVKR